MRILSQNDPQWSRLKLGNSPLTVGRFGCTTTCISMLSDYFKCYRTPADIASARNPYLKYTDVNHPQGPGLIIWESFKLPPMLFGKRLRELNHAEIQISLKDPKKAVILEVEHRHWVVAVGKVPFTNVYRIFDPWDGKKKFSTSYKSITGSAHFYVK